MTEGKFMDIKLSKTTYIFGLRLWIVIGIVMGSVIFFILFLLLLWSTSKKRYRRPTIEQLPSIKIPMFSKEIKEVGLDQTPDLNPPKASNGQALSPSEIAGGNKLSLGVVSFGYPRSSEANRGSFLVEEGGKETPVKQEGRLHKLILEGEKQALLPFPYINSDSHESSDSPAEPSLADRNLSTNTSEVSHLGWGYSYSLRDIEVATDKLSDSNKLGEGGYGIVYRGHLPDGTFVAVKNLLNNRGQAEREFRVEVEAIGRVRHKNLVSLIGFCAEGIYRMLVYEYVENGNLYHWLHGALAENDPIPWDMRMHIAIGTAKGLAYLHDGLEPKVVHRDVKSSNILIDGQWNAKVSDFGLAKLLGSEKSHVTTRVMGTFGYVAPEYACTGLLTERSDVYSFGVLLMELITGRHPIDYRRPAGEINLVDWLKSMVGSQHSEDVIDPRLAVKPSARSLKRALLVALRCVDPDAEKRPKMGHVVHMLEADDPTFHDDCRIARAKNLSK